MATKALLGRMRSKTGRKGSAALHARYVLRLEVYGRRLEERGPDGQLLETLAAVGSGNMPRWAEHNPVLFWEMSDKHEREKGSVYREHELALPRGLSVVELVALVEAWIAQEIGDLHAYTYGIHISTAADGEPQPHVHLMFSERQVDGIQRDPDQYFKRYNSKNPSKGGCKKGFQEVDASLKGLARKRARSEALKAARMRWQELVNLHLERAGIEGRIDMRSYKDRWIKRMPEPKLPPSAKRNPEVMAVVLELREAQNEEEAAAAAAEQVMADIQAGRLSTTQREPTPAEVEAAEIEAVKPQLRLLSAAEIMDILELVPPDTDRDQLVRKLLAQNRRLREMQQEHAQLRLEQDEAEAELMKARRLPEPRARQAEVTRVEGVLNQVSAGLRALVSGMKQLRHELMPAMLQEARRLIIRSRAAFQVQQERRQEVERVLAQRVDAAPEHDQEQAERDEPKRERPERPGG